MNRDPSLSFRTSFGFWISRSIGERVCFSVLATLFFALCLPAYAQQPTKVAKIGRLGEGGARSGRESFDKLSLIWAMLRVKT